MLFDVYELYITAVGVHAKKQNHRQNISLQFGLLYVVVLGMAHGVAYTYIPGNICAYRVWLIPFQNDVSCGEFDRYSSWQAA